MKFDAWIALLVASTVVALLLNLGPPDMMFLGGEGVLAPVGVRYWFPMRPAHFWPAPANCVNENSI